MSNKAKFVRADSLENLINWLIDRNAPGLHRDIAIMYMSHKAGLRACELAGLNWINVLDVDGQIDDVIEVPATVAKKGRARAVPMHVMVSASLQILRESVNREVRPNEPIFVPDRPVGRYTPNNMQRHMGRIYKRAGFVGCSSHSGRRTFITKSMRAANNHDASARDVQIMAGHRFMDTTMGYIEPSENVKKLVNDL